MAKKHFTPLLAALVTLTAVGSICAAAPALHQAQDGTTTPAADLKPILPEEGRKTLQFGDIDDGKVRGGKPVTRGWTKLFDGKTLNGWVYEPGYWKVEDGAIVGDKAPMTADGKGNTLHHHYMFSDKDYSDFEMHIDFKMTGYNSGVCARIHPTDFDNVPGYQVDMGDGFWGCLWDERHREKKIFDFPGDKAKVVLNAGGWNHYYFRMQGPHITIFLNGIKTAEGDDPGGFTSGPIGFQLCHAANTVASFRNIYIKPYAPPTAGTAPAVPATVVP